MEWRSAEFSERLDAGIDGVRAAVNRARAAFQSWTQHVEGRMVWVIGTVGICPYDTMFVRWNANLLMAKARAAACMFQVRHTTPELR